MRVYKELLRGTQQIDAQEVVTICKSLLPVGYSHRPYRHPELKNGVGLLQTEEGMNAYMAAYGEMHIAKCRAALQNFPFNQLKGTIEIVDWGCGQGIGSLCLLEVLSQRNKAQWIKRITLIEPSAATLDRAIMNVMKMTNGGVSILPLQYYLPGKAVGNIVLGLDYSAQCIIHIFSNILDVEDIDLAQLACMIPRAGHQHFVLCMGPVNANAYRMDLFCKIFGEQYCFSDLENPSYGRTSDTYYQYTCKTKCFVYDGSPLNLSVITAAKTSCNYPVYSEYDPQLAVQNGVISENLKKLYLILINKSYLTDDDFIILKPDIKGDTPDVVVVRPNKGILIINLFEEDLNRCSFTSDEKGIDVNRIMVDGKEVINSPLLTIQYYYENLVRLHLEDMLERIIDNNRNLSTIKKMILFTKNTKDEIDCFFQEVDRKYTYCCGREFLTDTKQQAELIDSLRLNYNNPQFDNKILKSFLRIISPAWHSYKEGKIINLSASQRSLALSIAGKKQKISGVAGSGKTQVLATRAVNAQIRSGKKVLILTYTKSLVNFIRYRIGEIRADFPWNKVVIDYYHNFIRVQANSLGLPVYRSSYDREDFFESVGNKIERFSAIFIDEVQDYQTVWLKMLNKYFLEEGGEFVVFGDPKQNIFKRELDSNGDIRLEFIGGSWNHELKERQRFTNPQLAHIATAFQIEFYDSKLPTDVFKDTDIFQVSMFSRIKYRNIGHTVSINIIGDAVRQIIEENQLCLKETVILSQAGDILRDIEQHYHQWSGQNTTSTFISTEQCQHLLQIHGLNNQQNPMANYRFKKDKEAIEHNKKLHFTTDTDYLKMATIHSFKGWEASNVIFILEPESTSHAKYSISAEENVPELIYTAITRAKENLFIINLGNDKYHNFFNSNI